MNPKTITIDGQEFELIPKKTSGAFASYLDGGAHGAQLSLYVMRAGDGINFQAETLEPDGHKIVHHGRKLTWEQIDDLICKLRDELDRSGYG